MRRKVIDTIGEKHGVVRRAYFFGLIKESNKKYAKRIIKVIDEKIHCRDLNFKRTNN